MLKFVTFFMDWIPFFWQIWGYFANNFRGPRFFMYRRATATVTFCCRVIWTCTCSLKFFLVTRRRLIMSNIHNTCRHSLILFPLWFINVTNWNHTDVWGKLHYIFGLWMYVIINNTRFIALRSVCYGKVCFREFCWCINIRGGIMREWSMVLSTEWGHLI
jgi:hypothetical protein